ncbi:MAG: GNAT family N-acetyltransferase, partial [Synergistaceae bacterium]|nr:GNAT family N-acetyltransferase [Synergistaceae bacterium]
MQLFIGPLDNIHDKSRFNSGSPELDTYLKEQAGQDARRKLSAVFVLTEERITVVGYYTLSQYALEAEDFPQATSKKLPKRRKIACTLLGRLAVDSRCQGLGYGRALLFHALKKAAAASEEVASFAVVVDAKDETAKLFYEKNGFLTLRDEPLRLFIPIKGLVNKLNAMGAV